jgi:hypothetical protein
VIVVRRLPLGLPALFATVLVALVASGAAAGGEAATPTPTPTPTPAAAATARRSAEPQPPLSFGRASYTWTVKSIASKLPVELVSEAGVAVDDPVLQVSSARLTDGRGAQVTADEVIRRTPETVSVPAGGSTIAELQMRRLLAPGTYSVRLSAGRAGSGPLAHATVSIVFPGAKVPPTPLSDKQTVQAVRWIPLFDRTVQIRGSWIPLHAEPDVKITSPAALDLEDGTVLGALAGDQGGVAAVRSIADVKKLPSRVPGVQFAASGFDGPGKYTGTLDLLPDDEKAGTVEMTIVTKDAVIWPILALGIGIFIALRVLRWRNVRRRVIVWERRINAAKEANDAAEERLKSERAEPAAEERREGERAEPAAEERREGEPADRAAGEPVESEPAAPAGGGPPPWTTYRVSDFDHLVKNARNAMAVAALTSATSIPSQREKDFDECMVAMGVATADLESVRSVARELTAALDDAELTAVEDLPVTGKKPAWAATAEALLVGARVSADDLKKRLTEMQVATEFLTDSWPDLRERVGRDAAEILAADSDGREEFKAAWKALWDEPKLDLTVLDDRHDAAELARREALGKGRVRRLFRRRRRQPVTAAPKAQRLVEARRAAAAVAAPGPRMSVRLRLLIALAGGGAAGGAALLGNTPNKVAAVTFVLAAAGAEATAYAIRWVRGQFARDELRLGDTVVVALAVAVAIVTGLTALYFGKTFGTPSDYLTATLWGLSTAGAVSGIAEVLQALADSNAPQTEETPTQAAAG